MRRFGRRALIVTVLLALPLLVVAVILRQPARRIVGSWVVADGYCRGSVVTFKRNGTGVSLYQRGSGWSQKAFEWQFPQVVRGQLYITPAARDPVTNLQRDPQTHLAVQMMRVRFRSRRLWLPALPMFPPRLGEAEGLTLTRAHGGEARLVWQSGKELGRMPRGGEMWVDVSRPSERVEVKRVEQDRHGVHVYFFDVPGLPPSRQGLDDFVRHYGPADQRPSLAME